MITRKYCADCGKELVTSRYMKEVKRCKSCSNRFREYSWSEKAKERKKNEANSMWKGEKVGYGALHDWIRRRKPKSELCEECNQKRPRDLANISGKYLRSISDFRWLCRKCHTKQHYPDGRWGKNNGYFSSAQNKAMGITG